MDHSPILHDAGGTNGVLTGALTGRNLDLIRWAILAPSTFNTQPWKFRPGPDGIDLYADYTRRLPVADPAGREMLMSIGAALMNLRVAAASRGLGVQAVYNYSGSSEEPLVRVQILPAFTEHDNDQSLGALFPLIERRHTNRKPFLDSRVPSTLLEHIRRLGVQASREVVVSTDGRMNSAVADLIARADQILLNNPAYRREVSAWLDPLPAAVRSARTGAMDEQRTAGHHNSSERHRSDVAAVRASYDRNLCLEAPALLAIGGDDVVPDWLAAGEFLERLLLELTKDDLRAGYFNVPVHVPDLRLELQTLLGLRHVPQLLLRIGYCLEEHVPTQRRPLEDILVLDTQN